MSSIGSERVLKDFDGSRLAVAEALILGNINNHDILFAEELISLLLLEVARIRLEATGYLTAEHIKLTIK